MPRRYDSSTKMWTTFEELTITDELVQDFKVICGLDPIAELRSILETEAKAAIDRIITEAFAIYGQHHKTD